MGLLSPCPPAVFTGEMSSTYQKEVRQCIISGEVIHEDVKMGVTGTLCSVMLSSGLVAVRGPFISELMMRVSPLPSYKGQRGSHFACVYLSVCDAHACVVLFCLEVAHLGLQYVVNQSCLLSTCCTRELTTRPVAEPGPQVSLPGLCLTHT